MALAVKSLKSRGDQIADPRRQLQMLNASEFPRFQHKLNENGLHPLKTTGIDIFQINLGKMCNQACAHCHVDAGPDRKEIMDRETMEICLDILSKHDIKAVDLTGGAPEMNPHFRWFVKELSKLGKHIMVRCNLTIIVANQSYHDLPEFYREHEVEVISSLPYFRQNRTDRQRGDGVFERSIKALNMLNEAGYGKAGSGLILNLVYNPAGAFLPGPQHTLEQQFRRVLSNEFGIEFNQLFCITNLPISRYLEYLVQSGNLEAYMERLTDAFNPAAAANVMCRNTLSVGWDGSLYDCDFNQMLEMKTGGSAPKHIRDFDMDALNGREIVLNQHCFGCTAGAGSSCGGETVK